MKVIVNDVATLNKVRVAQVNDYLKQRGWKRMRKRPWMPRGTFWRKASGGKEPWEVLVPDAETFGDYPLRISELLEDVALQEGRSQVAVLRSIQAAGAADQVVITWVTPVAMAKAGPPRVAHDQGHQKQRRFIAARKLRRDNPAPAKA